mmetsp:Transcript_66759/g.134567  ORF Transcript_66759/g.134567 Transcript_66759/m.134567 type:complete len:346 (-) Transcript_66759:102-1139(-)|eukprot:CAMPEP_0171621732 /NCGR_PEP_ID=MMETSP0990-20121206/16792_1 /TAXON_ID=483369 /ORGANISM="non described non described, Strain CCMP2098" /LENGTH=345 /DNA_ID=CAMNT_0012187333 /DNA_START=30 /DNA_END=1067 /DNA_ORIENTATION=-
MIHFVESELEATDLFLRNETAVKERVKALHTAANFSSGATCVAYLKEAEALAADTLAAQEGAWCKRLWACELAWAHFEGIAVAQRTAANFYSGAASSSHLSAASAAEAEAQAFVQQERAWASDIIDRDPCNASAMCHLELVTSLGGHSPGAKKKPRQAVKKELAKRPTEPAPSKDLKASARQLEVAANYCASASSASQCLREAEALRAESRALGLESWARSKHWLAERAQRREANTIAAATAANYYTGAAARSYHQEAEAGAKAAQQAAADIGFSVFVGGPLPPIPLACKTSAKDFRAAAAGMKQHTDITKSKPPLAPAMDAPFASPASMIPELPMELPPALVMN